MKARQRKKVLKQENDLIEKIINERILEDTPLVFKESHGWKTNGDILEIRYVVKDYEWWSLLLYVNRKEAKLTFRMAFLPLENLPIIREEVMMDTLEIGVFEGGLENFYELSSSIEMVLKNEYYYIALKYSGAKKLSNLEAEKWYNEFVQQYNSLQGIEA